MQQCHLILLLTILSLTFISNLCKNESADQLKDALFYAKFTVQVSVQKRQEHYTDSLCVHGSQYKLILSTAWEDIIEAEIIPILVDMVFYNSITSLL